MFTNSQLSPLIHHLLVQQHISPLPDKNQPWISLPASSHISRNSSSVARLSMPPSPRGTGCIGGDTSASRKTLSSVLHSTGMLTGYCTQKHIPGTSTRRRSSTWWRTIISRTGCCMCSWSRRSQER